MAEIRAFISFDFDNDQDLRNLLVGQAKNPDSPFEIADWSVKEPWPEHIWKSKCHEKICKTDVVIVLVGEKTYTCSGVKEEIKMSQKAKVPYFGLHGRANRTCPKVEGLDKVYKWTWDNLKALLGGAR